MVVDDEPAVQSALSRALTLEHYAVAQAVDGQEALERLGAAPYEAVILDIAMPRMDGLEVCRRLREGGDTTPVLMLTARGEVDDRVAGLDAGADDYLVKPFALRELLARVRALLRRAGEDESGPAEILEFEDLRLDLRAHEAWRGERMLQLTRTEFLLLELFMRHPRQVLSRSVIFEQVWGYDFGSSSNSLGVYMGYLQAQDRDGRGVTAAAHRARRRLRAAHAPMSFRRRITLVSAAAVAVAVMLASLLTYVLTSNQLHSQVDTQLSNRGREAGRLVRFLGPNGRPVGTARERAELRIAAGEGLEPASSASKPIRKSSTSTGRTTPGNLFGRLPPNPDQVRGYQQVVDAGGKVLLRSAPGVSIPVNSQTRSLAVSGGRSFYRDVHVAGIHMRVLAEPFGSGRAVQLALPLTEVDSLLSRLRLILVLLDIGGVALAALLGRLVAGAAVQPLRRLTEAAEHVAVTRDLSRRIEPVGEDEIGRLAGNFNAMLDALDRSVSALDASVHAQRQLVADASHELRTPVTSLRTNIEILQQQGPDMELEEQRRLLADVVEQIEELTAVINDLIDLARGEEPRQDSEEVRLDLLVQEVAQRVRRHTPSTPLVMELEPIIVTGVPARLERAVSNLIDNAVKYSPPEDPVEVRLTGTQLTVRDHGPGISAEDLPHIFDRFYRGAEARGRPGSGLGLAIVRQVAGQQEGSIAAEPAPGGGTLMRLTLPGAERVDELEQDGAAEAVVAGLPGESRL